MLVTGEKILELTNQDSMTFFLKDMFLDNVTGMAHVGFSGQNQSILFKFISGKIYDFEDRYIDTYNTKERINISGTFDTTKYNYNLNNESSCNVGQKNNFNVGYFYAKVENCTLSADATIYSDPIDLSINFPQTFVLGDTITGYISNYSANADITIESTEIGPISTDYYELVSSPSSIGYGQRDAIVVNNKGGREGVLPLLLYISTNVGDIHHNENINSTAPVNYDVSAFLKESAQNQGSLTLGEAGAEGQANYSYSLDVMSGSDAISGDASISLEYYSGKIGQYRTVTGITLSNSGKDYSILNPVGSPANGYAVVKFSEGLGSDVRASGYIGISDDGYLDESRFELSCGGAYFESAPTVTFDAVYGASGYHGTGYALVDLYEKTFTGCWDLKTGTSQSTLHDYRLNNLTGAAGQSFYPSSNFGPGKYVNQVIKAPIMEDLDVNIINRKTKDKDYMLVKLIVSGGHSDLSTEFIEEVIITGGTS
jgi:hypothetical protein